MPNYVYALVDPIEKRTFAEVGADGVTCVTLTFPTRKAAHDYRNRHGLAQRLTPQEFASDHLDRAAALSLEWYGEPATWRLVTDRSEAPNVTADRVDPITLRRAFATLMVRYIAEHDADLAVDMIRRQLGHASLEMTAYYSKIEPEDLDGVMRSPLSILNAV